MSRAYRVVVVGLGKRGMHHVEAFAKSPRFKVVGLCDRHPEKLEAARKFCGDALTTTDARELVA